MTDTDTSLDGTTEEKQLAEKRRQHQAFVSARLVLVLLFIGLWIGLLPPGYPMPYGFLAVLLAEAAVLLIFRRLVRGARSPQALERVHHVLLFCELGFHTAIVYFLGGVSWLGAMAYLYAVIYAAVFLTWRQAALFTAAVCASFLAIVSLDGAGVLPHQWYLPQGPDRYQDPDFLVTTSVAFVGVIATVTFWMVFIGGEMRRQRDVALRANVELLRVQEQMRQLNDELEKKVAERTRVLAFRAEHDQLTGLLNRGSMTRRSHEMLSLARRGERTLALIIADGDNFKLCNDTGGHGFGDHVLRTLADSLKDTCRESDLAARIGGDEFMVLLPDTGWRGALRFCRRLVKVVETRRREWAVHELRLATVSLGIAVFPEHGSDLEDLIRVADRAMYDAKAAGGASYRLGSGEATFRHLPVAEGAAEQESSPAH